MRKALFILSFIVFAVSGAFAQSSYPIYVAPTLTAPYSLKLSDYCKFGSQQLMVNIVVNDLNVSNLPVKLHIKFETVGITIETPPTINTTPIYLDGGAASLLFGDDLKDYFNIDNLIFKGYSKEAYRRTGQLPEGFYKITVEVLHFQTNRLISNAGTVTAWIAVGKPPVLKLPENGKEMGEFKGMPIVFSWYASKLGNPMSAAGVQYKFEMWEMRIDGISPYTIAASVPVFYEETTTNTMATVFPASLLMEPGMKYAWRVTATDVSGMVPFEQDGHSEIRVFTYKSKCNPITNLKAATHGRNGSFSWEPGKNHSSYNVELKKPATGWLSASETFDSKAEFFDLDFATTYEMRVQAVCDNDPESVSDFSEWQKLEIPAQRTKPDSTSCPTCGCGDNMDGGTIENLEVRRDLKPGDTLSNRFGTTRFIVKSVESQGDGVYKGHFLFWAELWKLKFVCEYWDLSVNTDNVILNMDYQSVYNPQFLVDVDATAAYLDSLAGAINELTVSTTIKDTVKVTETITSIYVNAGDSVIAVTIGADGTVHEVVINNDAGDLGQTLITGPNGEEFVVTRDGDVMGVDEYKHTGGNDRKMDDYNKDKETHLSATQVAFTASPNQKYGFDGYSDEKQALKGSYPALQNGYIPTYKSIASFAPDKVEASNTEAGISFRDEMGIPAIKTGTDLTIRGGADGSTVALYAYKALTDTTEEVAGKLNIMSFDEQAKKVYIVPVNGATIPDATTLLGVLNKVYAQAVTRWEVVKIEKGVTLTFPDGQMTHGGSSAIAVYNTDQKSIISKFKEDNDIESDALYLFFVANVKGKTGDIAGYMPLQKQVGFIYDNPNPYIVAHELGHGAFNLRHPFSPESFIAAQGTTKNLMDYSGSTDLWKHQWDLIHDPEKILFAWGKDESEGAYIIDRWKLVRQYIDEFNGKTGTARTNYKFTYDNNKVAENFSTEAINQVNNLLTEYLKESDEPVFVVLELFTHTEEKDVADIKSIVEQECLDILKEYPNTVLIPVIGCQLVNEGNAPIGDVEFYICKKVSEQKISQIGSYEDNWADLEEENVSEEVASFLEFLQSSPVFNDENCLELTYEELGISSASELNPNDVKEWVSLFAGDNGVTIDYSYTGYPMVTNSEIPMVSPNQPENSNADINIAVHFDENGKKIIICHHYKAGAIVIPSVTASGEPVQETTVDEIVGLSKVYAGKALVYAKSGGEQMQALFNSAVKGVVAAKTWTKTICDKMEVPQQTWNQSSGKEEAYKRSPVNLEPLMAGVGDGAFEEIKSIPELITLALDVAFDKEVRANLWQSLTSLSWEDIKNMPIKMVKDKVDVYTNSHATVVKHEAGKDGVAIASMFFGFGSAKKAKELAETVGKNSTDYAKALQKAYNKIDVSKIDEFGVKLDNMGGGVTGVKLKKIGNTNHTTIAKIDIDGTLTFTESEHVFEAVYEIEKKGGAKGYCVLDKADDGKTVFREIRKDIAEISHLLKTEPNAAFFWSGNTNGIGGWEKALEVAKNKGGITLEGQIEKMGIKAPKFGDDPMWWEQASAQYAKQVSGEVKAVVGKTLRDNNIWENVELIKLQANPKVTKITAIDPETLIETIIPKN